MKGLEFTSIKQFKYVIREYCLLNRHDVKFIPKDSTRYRDKCKSKRCNSMIFVRKVRGSKTFRLKTLYKKHLCENIQRTLGIL